MSAFKEALSSLSLESVKIFFDRWSARTSPVCWCSSTCFHFTPQPPISMTTISFLQSISWLPSDVTPRNSHPPLFGTERGTWPSKRSHVPTFVMQWKHTQRSVLLCAEVKAWLSNGGLISNACFGAARLLGAKCQGGKDLLWCWLTSDVAQRQRKALPNYSKENKFIVLVF